ncbi:MAG: DUF3995 domain-containing protein [Actinomycetota bacterium]
MTMRRVGVLTASTALFALSGLHAAWGAGSAWPLVDRQDLADAVIGIRTGARGEPGTGVEGGAHAGTWTGPGAETMARKESDSSGMPGPSACFAVSGALAVAGVLVAGWPARRWPRLHRLGICGVAGVLAGRGALGLAGQTRIVSPQSESERFLRLDRRVYSPACLTLAALSVLARAPRRAGCRTSRPPAAQAD